MWFHTMVQFRQSLKAILTLYFIYTLTPSNADMVAVNSKQLPRTLERDLRGASFQREFHRQINLLHALGQKLSEKVNKLREEEQNQQERPTTTSTKFWCFFNVVACY
ncbi:uncharacterized protein LOC106070800 isoform X1 [Biomphalaria glabrata]|uniref:Uncharacterized protein LOC106070800 isoform X1 n=1 Tax=Biomphalaria glabrata TaxID=6526 RepID=A0A9U8EGI6_BIOGL|nr:uncharacterized protein LOC106070800 isoform X1 [Biomphalaria glabrata]